MQLSEVWAGAAVVPHIPATSCRASLVHSTPHPAPPWVQGQEAVLRVAVEAGPPVLVELAVLAVRAAPLAARLVARAARQLGVAARRLEVAAQVARQPGVVDRVVRLAAPQQQWAIPIPPRD